MRRRDPLHMGMTLELVSERMPVHMDRRAERHVLREQLTNSGDERCREQLHPSKLVNDDDPIKVVSTSQRWQRQTLEGCHVDPVATHRWPGRPTRMGKDHL